MKNKQRKNIYALFPLIVFNVVLLINFFVTKDGISQTDVCYRNSDGSIQREATIENSVKYSEEIICQGDFEEIKGDILFEYYGVRSNEAKGYIFGKEGTFISGGNVVLRYGGLSLGDYDGNNLHWLMTDTEEQIGKALGFSQYEREVWYVNDITDEEKKLGLSYSESAGGKIASRLADLLGGASSLPKDFFSMPTSDINLGAGQDKDGDGLSDEVEKDFGTNPEAEDSDRDGYSDYIEVVSGYDPLSQSMNRLVPADYSSNYKNTHAKYLGKIFNSFSVDSLGEASIRYWYVNYSNGVKYYLGSIEALSSGVIAREQDLYVMISSFEKNYGIAILGDSSPTIEYRKAESYNIYSGNDVTIDDNLKMRREDYDPYREILTEEGFGVLPSTKDSKGFIFEEGEHKAIMETKKLPVPSIKDETSVETSIETVSLDESLLLSSAGICGENTSDSKCDGSAGDNYRVLMNSDVKVNGAIKLLSDINIPIDDWYGCFDEFGPNYANAENYFQNKYGYNVIGDDTSLGCNSADSQKHKIVCKDNRGMFVNYIECATRDGCKCQSYARCYQANGRSYVVTCPPDSVCGCPE